MTPQHSPVRSTTCARRASAGRVWKSRIAEQQAGRVIIRPPSLARRKDGPRGMGSARSAGRGAGRGDLQRCSRIQQGAAAERETAGRVQRGTPESADAEPAREHEGAARRRDRSFKPDYAKWQCSRVTSRRRRTCRSFRGALRRGRHESPPRRRRERVPDAYTGRVSKYFESIATTKRKTPPK